MQKNCGHALWTGDSESGPGLLPRVAELTKLLENIYRSVNIALVNELKMLSDRMGLIFGGDRSSKYQTLWFLTLLSRSRNGWPLHPIDPFYLSWKAREYDFTTKFIQLAGEINVSIPYYVVSKTVDALNERSKSIKGAKVLILESL